MFETDTFRQCSKSKQKATCMLADTSAGPTRQLGEGIPTCSMKRAM